MKHELAEILTDELGVLIEIELREIYSGRGMYGDTTSGVVVDSMTDFLSGLGDWLDTMHEDDFDTAKKLGEAIRNVRTDSMGKSIIIY